jgi:hypothetical protein
MPTRQSPQNPPASGAVRPRPESRSGGLAPVRRGERRQDGGQAEPAAPAERRGQRAAGRPAGGQADGDHGAPQRQRGRAVGPTAEAHQQVGRGDHHQQEADALQQAGAEQRPEAHGRRAARGGDGHDGEAGQQRPPRPVAARPQPGRRSQQRRDHGDRGHGQPELGQRQAQVGPEQRPDHPDLAERDGGGNPGRAHQHELPPGRPVHRASSPRSVSEPSTIAPGRDRAVGGRCSARRGA